MKWCERKAKTLKRLIKILSIKFHVDDGVHFTNGCVLSCRREEKNKRTKTKITHTGRMYELLQFNELIALDCCRHRRCCCCCCCYVCFMKHFFSVWQAHFSTSRTLPLSLCMVFFLAYFIIFIVLHCMCVSLSFSVSEMCMCVYVRCAALNLYYIENRMQKEMTSRDRTNAII